MTPSHILLIAGAPRSGTSMVALIFKEQGLPMYLAADAPDHDSPSGNQEDNLARLLNNALMGTDELGGRRDWDNPRYVRATPVAGQRIKAYIETRYRNAGGGSWGLKDPRLCFAIEPWHMATAGLAVRWLRIRREDRAASVRSLIRMLPPRMQMAADPEGLHRLASNWLESYHLASELGFARTGIEPYNVTYESLLTVEGRERLQSDFDFKQPISCVDPRLNRQGDPERAA